MDDAEAAGVRPPAGTVRLEVEIPVHDEALRIVADVPETPLRMSDVMPLAYQICDRIVAASVRHGETGDESVQCRKGCAACCIQPVVISVPEAFRLIADIASLEADRARRVEEALAAAQKRLAAPGPPAKPCPLLADSACSVYPFRPCVCRAFLATSPPPLCCTYGTHILPVPVDVSSALRRWAAELEGAAPTSVLLSDALRWCNENDARNRRTWPAPQMVRQLFDALLSSAKSSSPAP